MYCNRYHFQTINTAICYVEGHDVELCEYYKHTESPYIDADPKLINDVIFCCVKDSFVKELCLSPSLNIYPNLITTSAKAIQINKSLAKIHIKYSRIGCGEALAISDCLKVNALKELIISKCNLTDQALRRIVDTVKCNKCTGLKQLSIYNISLSDGDMYSISHCLKCNTTLQELVIVRTNIIDNGALLIAEAILVNTTLLVLDISHNQISYKGVVAISDSLRYNNYLQELNVSYNNLTLEGVKYLGESVKTNATLLEVRIMQCCERSDVLKLDNNSDTPQPIGSYCGTRKAFLVVMGFNQLQQKVTVESTDLFDDEMVAISNCLQSNKVLQDFKLFKCYLISEEELQNISHNIHHSTEFDSVDNHKEKKIKFTKLMARAVDQTISKRLSIAIDSVKGNKALKTLVISLCGIRDEGAAIISDCIIHNTSIRELDLSFNFITSKGAVKIFGSMEVNNVIQSLNVSYNKMSDDGALAASECLKKN